MIEKEKFRKYQIKDLDRTEKPIPVRLNGDEWEMVDDVKNIIQQPKNSTTIKFLMQVGYRCIKRSENQYMLTSLFKNRRNNKRNNIIDFD